MMYLVAEDMAMQDMVELPDNALEMVENPSIPFDANDMKNHPTAIRTRQSELSLQGHWRSSI